MRTEQRLFYSLSIALMSGVFCYAVLVNSQTTGDLFAALRMGRDLLAGSDPYRHPTGPDLVSYPLPAGLVALPFSFLPDPLASVVFMAASSGLLAWFLLQKGETWRLGMLLSWPFIYCLFFAQWIPLVVCLWFAPSALFLILVKPQSALPLALTGRLSRTGIVLTLALGLLSLLLYPTWPLVWLQQVSGYKGLLPPLFALPLGPLILLAFIRWRDRRAWLLVLMALMPQRVVYDQLALMLVAANRREMLIQVAISWITLPALLIFGGWTNVPGGWQLWIIASLYLPALGVLLFSKDRQPFLFLKSA